MKTRAAWLNPVGLMILTVGAAAAAFSALAPAVQGRSSQSDLLLILAIGGYLAASAVVGWSSGEPEELRQVRRLRDAIADRLLLERTNVAGELTALGEVLSSTIARLDRELIPSIDALLKKQALLKHELQRFQGGDLVSPDPTVLRELELIEERQRGAIDTATRQVANAYGATVALTQQSMDESSLVREAETLAERLRNVSVELVELLDESTRWDRLLQERSLRHRG